MQEVERKKKQSDDERRRITKKGEISVSEREKEEEVKQEDTQSVSLFSCFSASIRAEV